MSNTFEARKRNAFDPSAIKRSMAERDPERVHFEHKYGDDVDYFDKDDREKRVARLKEIEEKEAVLSGSAQNEALLNEKKAAEFPRIDEHNRLKEESLNRAGQVASRFVNEVVLKSHGVSREELNSLKEEDRELLVESLSSKNSDAIGSAALRELALEDSLALNTKKSPKAIEDKRKIFNFQLGSLKKSLVVFEKAGNFDKVEKIKLDIQKIEEDLRNLGVVSEKQKVHHWPPEGYNQKDGTIQHWPPVVDNYPSQKNLPKQEVLMGVKSPEDFRGGEKELGLEDPLNSNKETPAEQVVVSQESKTGLDHAAIIENDKKKLAEAKAKGQTDIVSFYEKSLKYHEDELKKGNLSQQEVQAPLAEVNTEVKEGSAKKSILDLKYSQEEINGFTIEEQQQIFKEQIPRNVWFKEEAVAPTSQIPEQKEELFTIEKTQTGLDGSSQYIKKTTNAKGVEEFLKNENQGTPVGNLDEQIENAENFVEALDGVDSAKDVLEEKRKRLEDLKKLRDQRDSGQKDNQKYEKNKDHLLALGWSEEEFNALTSEEKEHVLWKGIKEENYSRNKAGNFENDKDQALKEEIENFATIIFSKRTPSGEIYLKGDEEVFYKKHIDAVEESLQKLLDKETHDLSAKGTSEGAKEFLKEEKEKVETDLGLASEEIKEKLKDFKISERDMLILSPEFFSLSAAKQQYLFSKLEQKIYLDADFASKIQNEEEIKKMGFWKKLGSSFVKGQRQVALRDKKIQEIKAGGIKDYRLDIKTLNDYLLDAPDLTYKRNENKKLAPHFEYVETASSDKKFETPKVFFNVAASHFSEMPFEWSLKTATSSQREAYQKAHSSYTGAKESLMKAMLEEAKQKNPNINEEGEKNIRQKTLLEIAKTDAQVKFGSFITQNPEMENLSAKIFEKVFGAKVNDFAKGAMFTGAGFLARGFGRSMALTGVGLVVSGAVGGFMADRKLRLAYTEKELRQRYGAEVKDLGIKTPINFKNVHERLSGLVNQLEKTTDEKSKQRILETIKTRLFVTEEMMRDGRINFGSQKEQTLNQYRLSEMVSKAAVTVEMNGGFSEQKTKEEQVFDRFKQFVKDDNHQLSKNMERLQAFAKGAGVAMLGFSIGSGLRYAQEQGYLGAAWEAISEKGTEGLKKAKEIISNFSSDEAPKSSLPKIPNVVENITPVETVMAGSRGVIGAIDDMQDKLEVKFGKDVPPQYKEFMDKEPFEIAREWGLYRPGEINESAKIMKGEGFSIDSKGVVRRLGLNGTSEVYYVPKGVTGIEVSKVESGREFFDAGKTGLASTESPSIETEAAYVESDIVRKPEVVNEGYATTKEVKSGPTNWFEKPVPTEFGASNVRGEWKFLTSPDGKITGINTSRTISDDVINFRKNPRNFMTPDLKGTKLISQTDSFAVKTLTDNREMIEKFLTEKNVLNAPNSNLTTEQTAFLKNSVSNLNKEIQMKTGGAFDGKYEEPSVFGKVEKPLTPKPERITYFGTDTAPKINPSVTSVSEGSEFVPNKTAKPEISPVEESANRKPTDALERIQKVREERAMTERVLSESKTTPKPVESLDNKLNSKVEIVSLSADKKTYSFNTENIKGQLRFIFDEKGVATNLQKPESTLIKGLNPVESVLKDDWMSKAKEFSSDEAVGIKKIRFNANLLKEYTTILKEGGFKENSAEYNYLQKEIKYIKEQYKEVLK